ncbi:unnamed protein product [Adineta steineri]|uniref:Glycosyltransferase n=1 Tax=Adineta steineri TaxID=433720 RepID=A0A814AZP9_9BILA|nr:unnamed protein product [Adineta steineri]CAF0919908.1 unnamed protein product [Adineta steineri]
MLSPWIRQNRVEFLALSPHTANYLLNQSLNKWQVVQKEGRKPLVRYFIPIFPVQILPDSSQKKNFLIGVQGDYAQDRRDYKMVFNRFESLLKSSNSSIVTAKPIAKVTKHNIYLHIVGRGTPPKVPQAIKNNVVFDKELNYVDYYTILSRCFVLLPAFSTSHYLDRKASSTIPASLIAGVPLVATKQIIDTYAYLNEDMVWLQGSNETDFDVIERVLKLSNEHRQAKIEKVKAYQLSILENNTKLARVWTIEALKMIGVNISLF